MGNVRLDFGNLPLVEAAVRASFESPIDLKFGTISRLHDELKTDFPAILEPDRIEVAPGAPPGQITFGPGSILGAVFTGNALGLTITVQRSVIVARWSRTIGSRSPDYPRFPSLRDTLWRGHAALGKAINGQPARIVVTNMSYVNFLGIPHTEPVHDYFSDLVHVKAASNAKQLRKMELSWQEPSDIDVRMAVEQASAPVADQTVEGFRLTTAAGLRLGDGLSPEDGLDDVHDRLQVFFGALLSDKAKEEWQLTEVPLAGRHA